MTRKFIFVLISLLSIESEAQRDSLKLRPDRFVFSLSAGVAFPTSNFIKNDPYPPETGKAYKLEFMYLPLKNFGVDLSFSRTINETQIPTEPVTVHFGGLGNPHPYFSYVYWSGAWQTDNYYADFVFQPNTKVAQLRMKVGGGLQNTRTPPVHIYYPSSNSSDDSEGIKSQVFVFHAGLDLRINLMKSVALLLNQDFYDSVVDLPSGPTAQKNIIFTTMGVGLTYSIR